MSYVKPKDVHSPKKNRSRLRKVMHDIGEGDWSTAEGRWDNDGVWSDVLAILWNGSAGAEIGNTQSRGLATWFILTSELDGVFREAIAKLLKIRASS